MKSLDKEGIGTNSFKLINGTSVCVTILKCTEMDQAFYLDLKILLLNNWAYGETHLLMK